MSTLIIVESPTKAKTISKFLGAAYKVESSFGHVRDLPRSKMGIDIEGGTFMPHYEVSDNKKEQVRKLKKLAKDSKEVIFATDEDREGEAISWHLAHILKIDPSKAKRIVFHEITKSAIDHALKHPRGIDQGLVDAQQARRVLDRLVGYELSPFLWKKVARGLSAGRVQSVAVRLIVDREKERKAFVPDEYWSLEGFFSAEKANKEDALKAKLFSIDEDKLEKLSLGTKEAVDAILSDLEQANYSIEKIEKKKGKRTPPPPFRTSTLQQQANQTCGYSSKQTMRLAQQLYEGISINGGDPVGLITYMRTDSTNLSEKFLNEAGKVITSRYGKKYSLNAPRVYKTKAKSAQEAHEAIRPTHPEFHPDDIKDSLDAQQYKLYSLIWRRAMATQMADAQLDKTSMTIVSEKTTKAYRFRANGQMIAFDGWLHLYPDNVKENMLPALDEGQSLDCHELLPEQHFTQPPPRYSDATLVKALEEHGIGRPSTYAPTIATIEAREYVERDDNKKFKPLDVANIVTDLLVEHFDNIVDFQFTAQMEETLDKIAEGKTDWHPVIRDFYGPFHTRIEEKTEAVTRDDVSQTREVGIDPKTNKPIFVKIGRFGPYVQLGTKDDEEKPRFASLKKGQSMDDVTLEEALTLLSLPRTLGQDEEGNDVKANIGRFGPYVQIKKEYFSLKKSGLDPYTISFEEAKEIVKTGREEKAKKIIKTFEDSEIQILRGPYGPYVKGNKKNARIPKDTEPESLSLADCEELLAKAPVRKRRTKKKAAGKKKK